MWLKLLPYIQFICFIIFAIGVIKYSFRTKTFFVMPNMKHLKHTKDEIMLSAFGLLGFVISSNLRGFLNL